MANVKATFGADIEQEALKTASELIIEFEGFREHAYICPAGHYTIGYGFLTDGLGWNINEPMTKLEADRILNSKIQKLLTELMNYTPTLFIIGLPPQCIGVIISFSYNVGLQNFRKSTLLSKIEEIADPEIIMAEFLKWTKAKNKILPGLVKRRTKEGQIFCSAYQTWLTIHSSKKSTPILNLSKKMKIKPTEPAQNTKKTKRDLGNQYTKELNQTKTKTNRTGK